MSWADKVGTGNRAPCLLDTYTVELVGQYQLMPLELDIYETTSEIYATQSQIELTSENIPDFTQYML